MLGQATLTCFSCVGSHGGDLWRCCLISTKSFKGDRPTMHHFRAVIDYLRSSGKYAAAIDRQVDLHCYR